MSNSFDRFEGYRTLAHPSDDEKQDSSAGRVKEVLIVDDDREISFKIGDVHLRPGVAADSGGSNAG